MALGHGFQVDIELRVAFVIQRCLFEFDTCISRVFVGVAKLEARQGFRQRILVAFVLHHSQQSIAARRSAVQVTALDVDFHRPVRRYGFLLHRQIEFHALRQKLLDAETESRGRHLVSRIRAQFQRPESGRCIRRQIQLLAVIAGERGFLLPRGRKVRLAVGALENGLHRLRRHWLTVGVARQNRYVEALAGPIQVAAGPGEEAHGFARQADDIVLGEIERWLLQRDQGKLLAFAGHQHFGTLGTFGKLGAAIGIRRGASQYLALIVQPRHVHATCPCTIHQAAHIGICSLGEQTCMQPQVTDIEVGDLIFVAEAVGLAHHRHVNARFLELLDVFDRNEGGTAAIGLLLSDKAAAIDAVSQLVQAIQIPITHCTAQHLGTVVVVVMAFFLFIVFVAGIRLRPARGTANHLVEESRQLIRLDAQELDVHIRHVDRDHWQTAVLLGRQYHALTGKIEGRRYGSHQNRVTLLGGKRLVTGRR